MDHKDAMEWLLCDKELDGLPRLEKSDCGGKRIIIVKNSEDEWEGQRRWIRSYFSIRFFSLNKNYECSYIHHFTWTRSCAACCRRPCFGTGVGLDDPQRSLPMLNILWFCGSHIADFKQAEGSAMKCCPGQKCKQIQKRIRQIRGGWVHKYLLNMVVQIQTLNSGNL